MSHEQRTTEEKIEEFKSIISKLKRREERLKERLFKGGRNSQLQISGPGLPSELGLHHISFHAV